jgi:hypothetical protein
MTPARARQKRILLLLGVGLGLAGIVVLLFVRRLPFPLRLEIACTDLLAAAALLAFRRQNYSGA